MTTQLSAEAVQQRINNLERLAPYTTDVVRFYIGQPLLEQMVTVDYAMTMHMGHTGEMMADILAASGVSHVARETGALAGGVHDWAKEFRKDIRTRVNSDRVFPQYEHAWVSQEHAAGTERAMKDLASKRSHIPGAFFRLRMAGFIGGRHHSILPDPAAYIQRDPAVALGYGLTDTLKALDPLQALGFDATRPYIKKKEGALPPERIYEIVALERGRPYDNPPIVEGREIAIEPYVSMMLNRELVQR